MKKVTRKIVGVVGIAAVGWSLWLTASSAGAQPQPAEKQPVPGKAPQPAAQPGLPPGHPPVGKQPDAQGQLPPRGRTPEQIRDLLERSKARGEQPQKGPGEGAAPSKVRYPRDEHGNCLRRGPHDPPPDI